jgi:hypothetical protein
MFVNLDDGTKARSATVGALAHEGIARLLARGIDPTPHQVRQLVGELASQFPRMEGRAHRQKLTASISSYFWHLLPPKEFIFHGAEVDLGTGRPDLLWVDFQGAVLLDEVKTGNHRALETSDTYDQVEKYREIAVSAWGQQFLGIRLLSTSAPRKSLYVTADGARMPLNSTPFRGGRS